MMLQVIPVTEYVIALLRMPELDLFLNSIMVKILTTERKTELRNILKNAIIETIIFPDDELKNDVLLCE